MDGVHRGGAGYTPRASNGNVAGDELTNRLPLRSGGRNTPDHGTAVEGRHARARATETSELRLPRIVVTAEGEPSTYVSVRTQISDHTRAFFDLVCEMNRTIPLLIFVTTESPA